MPSKKQFEYLSLEIPFEINKMNMYEMLEHHTSLIKRLFENIEKEKKENYFTSVEIPTDEEHWYIWKEGEKFILENNSTIQEELKHLELEPLEFYNWVFNKAPFMSMIGEGYHKSKKFTSE